MKLTSRMRGWTYKPTPRKPIIGRTEQKVQTDKGTQIVFVEEKPIDPSLKVSDYSLRTQLENGVFANKDMGVYMAPSKLDIENLQGQLDNLAQRINYEQAKAQNEKKEKEQPTQQPNVEYTNE